MKKITVLLLMLLAAPVWATNYYVDYTGGNDANTPGTTELPRQTIPATLAAGDKVYLRRGVTYGAAYTFANSGASKTSGTNGVLDATGTVFTASGETFDSDGVVAGDYIYINGSGLIQIASVDSETQVTLSSAVPFDFSATGLVYNISNPILITMDQSWGTGAVIFTKFVVSNRSNIRIDGVVANGFETTGQTDVAVYGSNSATDIILQNLYIHDTGTNVNTPAIYLQSAVRCLVDKVSISAYGKDDTTTGDDGIALLSGSEYTTIDRTTVDNTKDDGIQFAACYKCYVQRSTMRNMTQAVVHADGFQANGTSNGRLGDTIFRYNQVYDCGNFLMLEDTHWTMYNSLIYATGTAGNFGIQKGTGSTGNGNLELYNNIFMNTVYAAVRENAQTATPKKTIIKNNIFFDSNRNGSNYGFASLNSGAWDDATSSIDYNIYIRKSYTVDGDTVAVTGWDATKRTLAAAQALGQDTNSKKCTASGCDWTWQSPYLFVSEVFATPNFVTYTWNSPQVNTGATVAGIPALDYVLVSRPQGSAWDMGAYEYAGATSIPSHDFQIHIHRD